MIKLNLYEAKTQLSSLVDRAAAGEEIVIAKNGKPVARLTSLGERKGKVRLGVAKGKFEAPDPDPELDAEIERMFTQDR